VPFGSGHWYYASLVVSRFPRAVVSGFTPRRGFALGLTGQRFGEVRKKRRKRKRMFGFLWRLFKSNSSETQSNIVGGAEDVFHAIVENVSGDKRYVATFGEPQLVDRGGEYSSDYMVMIPTSTHPDDPNPPNIEYDLPDAEMGETANELFDLLDYYNIDQVSDLGQLEGMEIVASLDEGTLSFQFD
jgi:hypothetical protein